MRLNGPEDPDLGLEVLGYRLDDEVGSLQVRDSHRGRQPAERLLAFFFGQTFFFNVAVEALGDSGRSRIEELLRDIVEQHRVAASNQDLRDAVPHGSRTQYPYSFDCHLMLRK